MAVYFSVLIYVQSNSFSTSRKIDLLSFILHIVKRVKKWYAIKSQNIIKKNFGVKCVRMRTRFIFSFSTARKYTFFYIGSNPNIRQHSFIRNILHTLPDYFFFWKYFKNLVLVVLQHSIIIILLFPISAITEAHTELLLYMT